MVDSTLSHEAVLRFEEIESRLDSLESKGQGETEGEPEEETEEESEESESEEDEV